MPRGGNGPPSRRAKLPNLVTGARSPRARPPWSIEGDAVGKFTGTQSVNDHRFAYQTNLVCSADIVLYTEVLDALIERRNINLDELLNTTRSEVERGGMTRSILECYLLKEPKKGMQSRVMRNHKHKLRYTSRKNSKRQLHASGTYE